MYRIVFIIQPAVYTAAFLGIAGDVLLVFQALCPKEIEQLPKPYRINPIGWAGIVLCIVALCA